MRVLWMLNRPSYLHTFGSTITEMGRRGHEVQILFTAGGAEDAQASSGSAPGGEANGSAAPATAAPDASSTDAWGKELDEDGFAELPNAAEDPDAAGLTDAAEDDSSELGMEGELLASVLADGRVSHRFWSRPPVDRQDRDLLRLRDWQDYLHFLEPFFQGTTKLRARSGGRLPDTLHSMSDAIASEPQLVAALRHALAVSERVAARTPKPQLRSLIDQERPDVVVTTTPFGRFTPQLEIARAAAVAGLPVVYAPKSWDNLVTAGVVHFLPTRTAVWNKFQKLEAIKVHGIPASTVVVTGAPAFDVWFDNPPSTPRGEWCAEIGFDPGRPYLLYVCSSPFITPNEEEQIEQWLVALRASRIPTLSRIQVLVRPHPKNVLQAERLERFADVKIYPQPGEMPLDDRTRRSYASSLRHSSAVVGVNTSALIESAIFGRNVHVYLSERYRATQEGTLHFRHLVDNGLLQLSESFDDHFSRLAGDLERHSDQRSDGTNRFLKSFVRPGGLTRPATPRLADAIETVPRAVPDQSLEALGVGRATEQLNAVVRAVGRAAKQRRHAPATEAVAVDADSVARKQRRRGLL
jgi:LmbE family N-acetylglucosaminyl deacetylase